MNLLKMSKGTVRGVSTLFAISELDRNDTRFNLPHQGGITDDGDYKVLTEITSYKRGLCRRPRKPCRPNPLAEVRLRKRF